MRKIKAYIAVLLLAVLVLTSCGVGEATTEADTTDIPVVGPEPLPYEVVGIDGAQLITGVSTRYALLAKVNGLEAVASKGSSERMYPASMTKVMTFIVAFENARSLEDKMTFTKEVKQKYADAYRVGIDIGDVITVEQLLYALILESDADAALLLADYIAGGEEKFAVLMNQKCAELGLKSTHFTNAVGMHDSEHYTTASEMTSIFAYALDIPLFRQIIGTDTYVTYLEYYKNGVLTPYRMTFYNTVISSVKGRFPQNGVSLTFGDGAIIGGKTGYTDEARYCLALLVRGKGGDEYILVTANAANQRVNAGDCLYICENYAK